MRRAGNEFLFQMQAMQNVEMLNEIKARKIVVTRPHCLNTIGREYPQVGGEYEVVHHTQLRATGRRRPPDPGQARRREGHLPRPVLPRPAQQHLRAAARACCQRAGVTWSRWSATRKSFCCGRRRGPDVDGGDAGSRVNLNRTDEALGTGLPPSPGCPFCNVMITDGVTARQSEGTAGENVQVKDVAVMLLDPVKNRGQRRISPMSMRVESADRSWTVTKVVAVVVALLSAGYMLPRAIAAVRDVPHWSVFWVNLLLGWTIVGWIVALVMSPRAQRQIITG